MSDYFDDIHPSLLEAFMYQGSLYQLPLDWNAANMYLNTATFAQAGPDRPKNAWTKDNFSAALMALRKARPADFTLYYWTNRLFWRGVPWLHPGTNSVSPTARKLGAQLGLRIIRTRHNLPPNLP
jgi:ABC-type glycerol-3-phosphate transport system substrate-binding protein